MIYQLYAIDPNVFRSQEDFIRLFERFGPANPHRLLLETPKKGWRQAVGNRFSQLDVAGKKRSAYVDQWKRIKLHKLIKGPDGASLQHVDEDWLIHHKNDVLRHGANGVFVSDDDVEVQRQLYSWSDPIAEGPPKWPISSGSIPITAQAVLDAVDSLIKVSTEYHLIDPYIWPHSGDRWIATEPIVEGIGKKIQAAPRVGHEKVLTIHTSDQRRGIQAKLDGNAWWAEKMAAQLPNVTIKFKVWSQSREHDRYFVTDRGGLVFTNSYQEKPDDPNNRYEVHPLSVERLAELRIKYKSNNSELLEVGLLREVK